MNYFVYLTDRSAHVIAGKATPYTFDNKADAEAYRRQLEAHNGFPPTVEPQPRTKRPKTRLQAWPSQTIYNTAAEAADALGVSRSAISQHINNPARYQSVKQQRLIRIDENGNEARR